MMLFFIAILLMVFVKNTRENNEKLLPAQKPKSTLPEKPEKKSQNPEERLEELIDFPEFNPKSIDLSPLEGEID